MGVLRHQSPFARSLEYRRTVALQSRLRCLERRHTRIEPRQLCLDGCDDAVLLGEGREGDWASIKEPCRNTQLSSRTSKCRFGVITKALLAYVVVEPF